MRVFDKDKQYPELPWVPAQKKVVEVQATILGADAVIKTLEGEERAKAGQVVIRGVKGEFYAQERAFFDANYDALGSVDESPGRLYGLLVFETGRDYAWLKWVRCVKKPKIVSVCQIADDEFQIEASWGLLTGRPGDYLMYYGPGDYAICARDVFAQTYILV